MSPCAKTIPRPGRASRSTWARTSLALAAALGLGLAACVAVPPGRDEARTCSREDVENCPDGAPPVSSGGHVPDNRTEHPGGTGGGYGGYDH